MSVIPEHELPEFLSALLDDELSADERAQVEAWLATDEAARAELDDLARVRALVRGLPAVEPPSGFFERLLADPSAFDGSGDRGDGSGATTSGDTTVVSLAASRHHRGRRRSVVLAAVVAVAAAAALVVGLAPATEKLTPPVETFLARHEKMAALPADESASLVADGFTPMTPEQLAAAPSQFTAPATMGPLQRVSAFEHTSGAMHVMYSDGVHAVSIFEQPGRIDWSGLPAEVGAKTSVGGVPAWTMTDDTEAMMVVEKGPMVYTVVGTAPAEQMTEMVDALPPVPESFWQRVRDWLGVD